jgi:hypothetical protein
MLRLISKDSFGKGGYLGSGNRAYYGKQYLITASKNDQEKISYVRNKAAHIFCGYIISIFSG